MQENSRKDLIATMQKRASEGKTCAACSGLCCTFSANSMLVTAEETDALMSNLASKNLVTRHLLEQSRVAISRFGLDRPLPGTGSRQLIRRRYTCPLFMHKAQGCPLDAEAKPYGCLAFNSNRAGETNGSSCRSATDLLQALGPKESWEKTTIPQAIVAWYERNKPEFSS